MLANANPANAADAQEALRKLAGDHAAVVFFAPRGIGLNAWSADQRRVVQIRRRFMLLGQTLDSMRVWDIRQACRAMRLMPALSSSELQLAASGVMAVNAACAATFEDSVTGMDLIRPPTSFGQGPDYLNVLRVLDVPQLLAVATERCVVRVASNDVNAWDYPAKAAALGAGRGRFEWRPATGR